MVGDEATRAVHQVPQRASDAGRAQTGPGLSMGIVGLRRRPGSNMSFKDGICAGKTVTLLTCASLKKLSVPGTGCITPSAKIPNRWTRASLDCSCEYGNRGPQTPAGLKRDQDSSMGTETSDAGGLKRDQDSSMGTETSDAGGLKRDQDSSMGTGALRRRAGSNGTRTQVWEQGPSDAGRALTGPGLSMGTVYCGPPPGGLSRRSAGIPRPLRGLRLRPPSGGRSTGPGLVTIVSLIIWRMMRIHLDDDEESSSFSSKTIHIIYILFLAHWHYLIHLVRVFTFQKKKCSGTSGTI